MHLAAFITAGPGRPGGWRFPASVPGWLSADYYQNIARTLEDGRFDLAFFADILSVPDRFGSSTDTQLRNGALGSMRLDPLHVLSSMGGRDPAPRARCDGIHHVRTAVHRGPLVREPGSPHRGDARPGTW